MAETEPPPREAGGLQHEPRHHAREHQAQHQRHAVVASTSRTTSPSTPASPRRTPLVGHNFKAVHRRPGEDACARPPPTSSSRPPRACATRSSACARPSSPSPTIPLARQADVEDRAGGYRGRAQVRPEGEFADGQGSKIGGGKRWRDRRASKIRQSITRARGRKKPRSGSATADARASPPSTSRCSRPTHSRARGRRPALASRSRRWTKWAPAPTGPFPARAPNIDPRAKAGAFGEGVRGPHKPTLDEMGPHAMLPVPVRRWAAPAEADAHHRRVKRRRRRAAAAAARAKPEGRGSSRTLFGRAARDRR